jgi:hypothetical protein
MKYIVEIEGQKIPVDEETGQSDDEIKSTLAPYYPDVKNAKITRTVKDEVTTISVVKQAGKKGLFPPDVYARMLAAPESENAAIVKARELAEIDQAALTVAERLAIGGEAQGAINEGEKQAENMRKAYHRLDEARGCDARQRPTGF